MYISVRDGKPKRADRYDEFQKWPLMFAEQIQLQYFAGRFDRRCFVESLNAVFLELRLPVCTPHELPRRARVMYYAHRQHTAP